MSDRIRVTAAIIIENQKVLITQRHPNDVMSGKWEFPGGKIEPGETPEICLRRELQEELGILTDVHEQYAVSTHAYPDRTIELLAYTATIRAGQVTLHEHSDACWTPIHDLTEFEFCEADLPIIEKLLQGKKDV